jgi:periplasmic protein TonB
MYHTYAHRPLVLNRRYLTAAAFSLLVHIAVLAGLSARAHVAPRFAAPDVLQIQLVAAAPEAPNTTAPVQQRQPTPRPERFSRPKPLPPPAATPRAIAKTEIPLPRKPDPAPEPASQPELTPFETASAAPPSAVETTKLVKAVEALVVARSDVASLNNPKPPYPLIARRRRLEGEVLLSVKVLRDGQPGDVRVKQSSGHDTLDEAALSTVRRWHFVPAQRGTTPVDSWVEVPIRFRLEG